MIFGLTSSSFIPQSDFRAVQNENGQWSGSQSFLIQRSALDTFTGSQQLIEGVPATTLDPNLPNFYSFLRYQSCEVRHEDGGWAKIEVQYVGFWSATFDFSGSLPATYSLNGTLEEVSILEHPKVTALADVERTALGMLVDGIIGWDGTNTLIKDADGEFKKTAKDQNITTTDGEAFATLIANGTTSYKRPLITWTKTESSTSLITGTEMNNLGKIDTPDGSPPEPNGSRDWLLIAADSTQWGATDGVFQNTKTWLLSDRTGWDDDLYN